MANVISGNVSNLDFRDLDISAWYYELTLTARLPTYASGNYASFGLPTYTTEFFGSGFSYDRDGVPNGGTVNAVREIFNGSLVIEVNNVSVPVTQVLSWSRNFQNETALVTLLSGNDTIIGSPFNDFVRGYTGNDSFRMGSGDDTVYGGAGNDVIDGEAGFDTVFLSGRAADFRVVSWAGQSAAVPLNGSTLAVEGIDKATSVEQFRFTLTGELVAGPFSNFVPLNYIASHSDLMNAFRTNQQLGFDHFVYSGAREGRPVTFCDSSTSQPLVTYSRRSVRTETQQQRTTFPLADLKAVS